MKLNKLTKEEEAVIIHKGTEEPFNNEYEGSFRKGVYVCRRCNAPLYRSEDKFDARCGWPSFDREIKGAVKQSRPDAMHILLGAKAELLCARCGAFLGHVFTGERFTDKNVRHCVNSISMRFIPAKEGKNEE